METIHSKGITVKKGSKKPSIWQRAKAGNYSPYGTYSGPRGNSEQWKTAFQTRFSQQEIKEIIGDDNPWGILGLTAGATQEEISTAFRQKAMETHPDRNPQLKGDTDPFRRVKAAYDKLRT